MKIFLLFFLVTSNAYSMTATALMDSAEQYANRNWQYQASLLARRAHLVDYTNTSLIARAKKLLENFSFSLANEVPSSDLATFYPGSNLSTASSVVEMREKLFKKTEGYKILLSWDIFLKAVNKPRWEDKTGCVNSDLNDVKCGRKSAGDYAIKNLTYEQRQNLKNFKDIVIDDLQLIREDTLGVPPGPGLARIFQILVDQRSIPALIQIPYVSMKDFNNSAIQQTNIIEIGRALIVQGFQSSTSSEITNSNDDTISLEDITCYNDLNPSAETTCQLAYIRKLVWDKTSSSYSNVKNLILDPKAIKPFSNALISHFTTLNQFEKSDLASFLKEAYIALAIAYDMDPLTLNNQIGADFKKSFLEQIKDTIEFLNDKRDIVGLHIARGLEELHLFIEGLPNEK